MSFGTRCERRLIDPELGEPLTRRGLVRLLREQGTPYSYEHVRKLLSGEPVSSETCNEAICRVLGLDAKAIWILAQCEKAVRRFGPAPVRMTAPDHPRARALWDELDDSERNDVIRVMEGILARYRLLGENAFHADAPNRK